MQLQNCARIHVALCCSAAPLFHCTATEMCQNTSNTLLFRCATVPLYCYRTVPEYKKHFALPLLHCSTVLLQNFVRVQHFTVPLCYCSTVLLQKCARTQVTLCCSAVLLFHCTATEMCQNTSTTALFRCATIPLCCCRRVPVTVRFHIATVRLSFCYVL